MRGFPHCRGVEILLPASNNTISQIKIPDQPDLRYARILGIETYTFTDCTQTFPSGYQMISGNVLSFLSLVLETNDADDIEWKEPKTGIVHKPRNSSKPGRYNSTQQNIKFLPLASLHRICNASLWQPGDGPDPYVRQLMEFDNMYVSWDKCFLQTRNGGLLNNSDLGVYLMVYYSWLTIDGIPIDRT